MSTGYDSLCQVRIFHLQAIKPITNTHLAEQRSQQLQRLFHVFLVVLLNAGKKGGCNQDKIR